MSAPAVGAGAQPVDPAPQTLVGFDFGARRIGVAVAERMAGGARPLATVAMRSDGPDWRAIDACIQEWKPHALVVGLPTHADGTPHRLAGAITGFMRGLKARYRLPVLTVDERLSSVEAEARVRAGARAGVDAIAAQVILETWLATPPRPRAGGEP
ncbi:MAG: Holliday junction resolvase RuvX [Gammaproteobacteria bacterium]